MALDDVLARIRNTQFGTTADNRTVDRGPSSTIQLNRPKALTALQNKYTDPNYQQAVAQLPAPVRTAIQQTDLRRIDRGQTPVNPENSIKAGVAAMTGQAVTPVADRSGSIMSLPTNAVSDLTTIVKSLPHLPGALVNEAKDLANGFGDNQAELAKQGVTGLEAQLQLPGVRMVPGAYVAKNVAFDQGELIKHPLMNLLDILPFASKLAAGTEVARAATAGAEAANLDAIATGSSRIAKPPRPIATVATKTLDEAGNVVPNRLGQLMDQGWATKPGQALKQFGADARDVSRTVVLGEQEAMHRVARPRLDDAVAQTYKDWTDLQANPDRLQAEYGITPDRALELGKTATTDPRVIATLPANEQQFVQAYRATTDQLADHLVAQGDLMKLGGEYFDLKTGKRLQRSFDSLGRAVRDIHGDIQSGGKVKGILDDLDELATNDPARWGEIRDLVDQGRYTEASKRLNVKQNYNAADTGVNDRRLADIKGRLQKARALETSYINLKKSSNPARFDEIINKKAGEQYLQSLQSQSVIPDIAAAEKFVRTGQLDQLPGFDPREWAKVRAGVRKTWEELKANGEDPVFMSRTTEAQANRLGVARFDGTNRALRTARARTSDMSPSVGSPFISVRSQAWDIIQNEVAKGTNADIQSTYGVAEQALRDRFTPIADVLATKRGIPESGLAAFRDKLIRDEFMPYDPSSMMPFSGAVTPVGEKVWVPRAVGETLQKMNSEGMSKLRTFNDPITRMWRVALLPLSPRWHLYNIVGGSVMTTAEVGPGFVRQLGKARDIMKAVEAGKSGVDLPHWIPRELERQIGLIGKEEATLALKNGAAMNKWWEQSAIGNAGRKFVAKSFDINSLFDDTYKIAGYLEGEAQALKKFKKAGMSDDVARALAAQEGIRVSRKVLQDVGGLTPFERGVMRQIFPFYTWLSHLMRFVMQYPMDHPWRAAVVSDAARIVMEDMGDGASTDMLDLISWGDPDARGRRKTISTRGLNPFSDAGNLFTLAGWLGSTNPLFQTAIQALGFEPQQGGIDLYPNVNYSPETGKMVVDTGNPVENLAINSLPQLGTLYRYMGQDEDFNKLMREDPEAAQRMLFSGIGLPGSYKRYSHEEGMIRNELKRQEASSNVTSSAYKTGDLDALVPFLGADAVERLKKARETGTLDQYLPSSTPMAAETGGG